MQILNEQSRNEKNNRSKKSWDGTDSKPVLFWVTQDTVGGFHMTILYKSNSTKCIKKISVLWVRVLGWAQDMLYDHDNIS